MHDAGDGIGQKSRTRSWVSSLASKLVCAGAMLLGLLGKRGDDGILRDIETVRANLLDRLREDILDRRSGVDELYAVWLLGGNGTKTLIDALLEGYALCLHAVGRATGSHAQRRLLGRDVVDEREHRVCSRDGQVVGVAYHLAIEPSANAW